MEIEGLIDLTNDRTLLVIRRNIKRSVCSISPGLKIWSEIFPDILNKCLGDKFVIRQW